MGDKELQRDPDYPDSLVEAACGGNRAAFAELFRLLYPRVHRTLWAMLGNEADAHDAAQEAWIKAWERRARFNFQSRFSTWVHRIAVNCALDALRRRKRFYHRFVSLFAHEGEGGTPEAPTPVAPGADPDLAELIEAALAELPEAQRTVLVLREYEGYSYAEIAKALGIRPGTVMSRLHLARQKLQQRLAKELS